jgi:hypothetical protein
MGTFKPIDRSIVSPEVRQALAEFAVKMAAEKIRWAVIDGLSVGVYARPRSTIDVDLVVLDETSILHSETAKGGALQIGTRKYRELCHGPGAL